MTIEIQARITELENQIGHPPWRNVNTLDGSDPTLRSPLITEWLVLRGMDPNKVQGLGWEQLKKCYCIKNYFDVVAGNRPKAITGKRENAQWRNSLDLKQALDPMAALKGLIDPVAEEIGESIIKTNNDSPDNTVELLLIIESAVSKTFAKEREGIRKVMAEESRQIYDLTRTLVHQQIALLGGDVSNKVLELVSQNIQNGNLELKLPQELTTKIVSLAKAAVEELAWDTVTAHPKAAAEAASPRSEPELDPEEIPNSGDDSLIPELDPYFYFDPDSTRVMRSSLRRGFNLYGYGPTGCGKSELARQVHAKLRRRMQRLNCNGDITMSNAIGQMRVKNGETYFEYGALPRAMLGGYTLVLDEADFMPPHIGAVYHPAMEPGRQLYIPETGEIISARPGFMVWAFSNTGGKGDTNGQYTGTEILNAAFLDRFAASLKMTYLPAEEEQKMLYKRFPNSTAQEIVLLVKLATEVRSAFERDELSRTLSTRKLIDYFSHREDGYTVNQSLDLVLLNWLDSDDENLVKSLIDRVGIKGGESND